VRLDLCEAFELYMLERHIADVLATGHFVSASFEKASDGNYRSRYIAPNRATLDRYLKDLSPALRLDFQDHFPKGVEAVREEWTVLKHFP
jgi:hypothetical protein